MLLQSQNIYKIYIVFFPEVGYHIIIRKSGRGFLCSVISKPFPRNLSFANMIFTARHTADFAARWENAQAFARG